MFLADETACLHGTSEIQARDIQEVLPALETKEHVRTGTSGLDSLPNISSKPFDCVTRLGTWLGNYRQKACCVAPGHMKRKEPASSLLLKGAFVPTQLNGC